MKAVIFYFIKQTNEKNPGNFDFFAGATFKHA